MTPLLSELNSYELAEQAEDRRYPKWSTLCLPRLLGHPTLDAYCIHPGDDHRALEQAVSNLGKKLGVDRLLVRSDGGIELVSYYRGGNTFALDRGFSEAVGLLAINRAVILMEPTNRFTNRLSVNLLIDRKGVLIIEALGLGYDVSDLNRGGILPQVIVCLEGINWVHYEDVWHSDFQVTLNLEEEQEQERRQRRLSRIANHILPVIGQLRSDDACAAVSEAKRWLETRGYLGLWERWIPPTRFDQLRRWYEDAFMIARYLQGKGWGDYIVCSGSVLGDGRLVYWDIVDGSRKFGARG